jgi:hypothetical protein
MRISLFAATAAIVLALAAPAAARERASERLDVYTRRSFRGNSWTG